MVHILKIELTDSIIHTNVSSNNYRKNSNKLLGATWSIHPFNTKYLPSAHQGHEASSHPASHFPSLLEVTGSPPIN